MTCFLCFYHIFANFDSGRTRFTLFYISALGIFWFGFYDDDDDDDEESYIIYIVVELL